MHYLFFGTSKLSLDKYTYLLTIYLFLGKYQLLLFFGTSKTLIGQVYYGQVYYDNLLVPGQVSTFAISTPLLNFYKPG